MNELPVALFSSSRMKDLTHVSTEHMPSWNPGQGFSMKQTHFPETDGFAMHELNFKKAGLGTHFDSASHMFSGKRTV